VYPLGARSKEQSKRRKEVYIEAGKPVYSWSSFEKSKPWGENSQEGIGVKLRSFPLLYV